MLGSALTAIGAVAYTSVVVVTPFMRSDPPPYAGKERAMQLSQNFQQLQEHQTRSDQVLVGIGLAVYSAQLMQAQAQIDAAARRGFRDFAAETLKASAELAIRSIASQQPAATPPPNPSR